ncbi:PREDICTED: inhibitor of Bruton tyrosine kinase-like [Branchiostoma belcheri]|uniref:Inhibitor of Bruton tyrosine kinase-like n=1 Tax=Branchiostoma belcheri TaxID=7741 RepID=A0A6P4ZAS4_BRABE|nr:PREDICTED: inhibitor of Bruton tyrosine kinase-like [Branchiostoma belcheri]
MERVAVEPDCTPRCRSFRHARDLFSVITQGTLAHVRAFFGNCHNSGTVFDEHGRTALHVAASCGKWAVVEWLLGLRRVEVGRKDWESGWTALHRAAFYGQVACALPLIRASASLQAQDKEDLTPLDLIRRDLPDYVEFRTTDPADAYSWGTNTNFTLGHGSQQSRQHPEVVEHLFKEGVSVAQVVMCKFHTVFLSHSGRVYTCGHGRGGRLGHGSEQTYMVPTLVEGLASQTCIQVAAARDHTVVLTDENTVFSFGLNYCHQLGVLPAPKFSSTPRQVAPRYLKNKRIKGVAAGRFHTVLWTDDAVYTCGLNAGHLGLPKGDRTQVQPHLVSALNLKDIHIAMVTASDGATVIATQKGDNYDVFLLTDYQCRKIASKQLHLTKLAVFGGHLDSSLDRDTLQEQGGDDLVVLALNSANKVYVWRPSYSSFHRCSWNFRHRDLLVTDLSVHKYGIVLCTPQGEGFTGSFVSLKKKQETITNKAVVEKFEKEEKAAVQLERIPFIHRATGVTSDPKGRNFVALQVDPKASLLEVPTISPSDMGKTFRTLLDEASCHDNIHDVIIQLHGQSIPAHKFILSSRSDYFRKLFHSDNTESSDSNHPDVLKVSQEVVKVEKVNHHIFLNLLQFIYSDTCDLLTPGYRPKFKIKVEGSEGKGGGDSGMLNGGVKNGEFGEFSLDDLAHQSAFSVYSQGKKSQKHKKETKSKESKSNQQTEDDSSNPVKVLQNTAKRFGVQNLVKRLEGVRLVGSKVEITEKKQTQRFRFSRSKSPHLYDLAIRCVDGEVVPCHKCVLVAQLEYFRSMLGSGWMETSADTPLELPIPADVLAHVLEFLYTDDCRPVREAQNMELLCNVLTTADRLLITQLKEMAEVSLVNLITLRNVAELLEFASVFNSAQLKAACTQFICLNMAPLLEARCLEVLSEDVLDDLGAAYRASVPAMCRRVITPYMDGPDLSSIATEQDSLEEEEFSMEMTGSFTEEPFISVEDSGFSQRRHRDSTGSLHEPVSGSPSQAWKKAKAKPKKRTRKRTDSTKGLNLSDLLPGYVPVKGDQQDVDLLSRSFEEVRVHDLSAGEDDGRSSHGDPEKENLAPPESDASSHHETSSQDGSIPECTSPPPTMQPGAVPKKGPWTWAGPSSPPSSAFDLRQIMAAEQTAAYRKVPNLQLQKTAAEQRTAAAQKTAAALRPAAVSPRTSPATKPTSVTSPSPQGLVITTKMSQKERKRQLKFQEDSSAQEQAAHAQAKGKPASNPWGLTPSPAAPALSFRQVLQEEEGGGREAVSMATVTMATSPPSHSREKTISWGLPVHGAKHHGSRQEKQGDSPQSPRSPQSPTEQANPWQRKVPSSPPAQSTVQLSAIIESEKEQRENLVKAANKPLALIQIEERAIQELLEHYSATGHPEEFITVAREVKVTATPVWRA